MGHGHHELAEKGSPNRLRLTSSWNCRTQQGSEEEPYPSTGKQERVGKAPLPVRDPNSQ